MRGSEQSSRDFSFGASFERWRGPAIALLDLDAFFASVEQLDHPEWRGKPVIVGGSPEMRGVVSTASYEARPYGVHSAMPAAEARRLCPRGIFTQGRFDRYRELSGEVMDIIGQETPRLEQVSIDEAFFDVTPGCYSAENPVDICERIQARVARLGVTCSIGLSTSKTVAKIASEIDKPRGLTVVYPGTEAAFLAPLPLRALSGIGAATERKLAALGIRTLGDLAMQSPQEMRERFGVMGPRMVDRARGVDHSPVRERAVAREVKSVSNERTFAQDLTDRDEIRAAIRHVSGVVGRRLRKKGLKGREVTLKIRFDFEHGRTIQRALPSPADDEAEFAPVALELLDEIWHEGMPVRLIGVGISRFNEEDAPRQASLFDEDASPSKGVEAASPNPRAKANLGRVRDAVRERFGEDALAFGHDLRFKHRTSDTQPMHRDIE